MDNIIESWRTALVVMTLVIIAVMCMGCSTGSSTGKNDFVIIHVTDGDATLNGGLAFKGHIRAQDFYLMTVPGDWGIESPTTKANIDVPASIEAAIKAVE